MNKNGRVQLHDTPPPPFALFSRDNPNTSNGNGKHGTIADVNDTIKNRQSSQVSALFFSKMNVDLLQDALRYRVWVETAGRHVIDRQSDTELLLVMRGMFLQEGKNLPYDIKFQVRQLNSFVLDFCVQRVVSEIGMYMRYRHDIANLPVPIDHAPLASTKGLNSMPTNPHIFKSR